MLLTALNFDVNMPTALFFLERFTRVAKLTPQEQVFSTYLCELTLVDAQMNKWSPSQIASAAIYVTKRMFKSAQLNWED